MREQGRLKVRRVGLLLLVLAPAAAPAAWGGEAEVLEAQVRCNAERVCHFAVTVRHADAGWKHYADRFEVRAPGGTVLGTRVLRHPHVEEQPFTRSLGGVSVPEGVDEVRIRARDSEHGFGPEASVAIPR